MNKVYFIVALLLAVFVTRAQTQQPQYIKDKKKGCLVWAEYYAPGDSVTWAGNCNNGYAEGKGELHWYEGKALVAVYEGDLQKVFRKDLGNTV